MNLFKKMLSAFLSATVIIGTLCAGAVTAGAEEHENYKVTKKTTADEAYCIQIISSSPFTIDLTSHRLADHIITFEYFCNKNTYKYTLDYMDRSPYPVFHINDELVNDTTDFEYKWDSVWVDEKTVNSEISLYAKTAKYINDLKTCSSIRVTCKDKKNTRVTEEDTTISLKKNSAGKDSEADTAKDISSLNFHNVKNFTYTGGYRKADVVVKDGDKILVKGTDYSLKYRNCKNIGTASVTITGKGSYTGEKTLTYKILPKKPVIKAAKTDSDTIKLTWNKTTGADKYEIYISKNGGQYKKLATTSGKRTSVTLSGFDLKKYNYKFKIRACTEDDGQYYYSPLSQAAKVK